MLTPSAGLLPSDQLDPDQSTPATPPERVLVVPAENRTVEATR